MDRSYLRRRGDKSIDIGVWMNRDTRDDYSGEMFTTVRELHYTRNRAAEAVGPKFVVTKEMQMYRFDENRGDRAIVTTVLLFSG